MGPNIEEEKDCSDIRCACGKLLLRITELGLQVKCGRCKRVQNFSLEQLIRDYFPKFKTTNK